MTASSELRTAAATSDEATWAELHDGYRRRLRHYGTEEVAAGFRQLGLGGRIEEVESVAVRVRALTGWHLESVDGMICERDFFNLLSERRFPIARAMRGPDEVGFSRLPDRFHDIFGHTPLLGNAIYGNFLSCFASAARRHLDHPRALKALMRVYWYLIECGLSLEVGQRKAFGAAILTSRAECNRAMSAHARIAPLDLDTVIRADYDSFSLQPVYFQLGSFVDLAQIAIELTNRDWRRP